MTETLVLIHGMWADGPYARNFQSFFEDKGFHCIAPTLRHHGRPAEPPHPDLGTTSLLDYAADLEAEIRALESLPILVGHSMGGLLAQMLAARGLAKAALLITPASPAGIVAIRLSVLRAFASGLLRWGFWRKPNRQTFGEFSYSMYHLLPLEEQRMLYSQAGYESGRAAAEIGFWLFDPHRAARVDAKRVTCPMLIVGASKDRITPVSVLRKVARKYRHVAEYKEFAGHAHGLMYEQGWEEIARYCADWLAGLDKSGD
ncbi:MAG: alpha/beta hydrolase [SAR324 cluster bacterium]|nr:alpha/beta hydrolase [SAR324 cluster bacterium]